VIQVSLRSPTLRSALAGLAFLTLTLSSWAAAKQTLTGQVSDAMCGKEHMQGTPVDCTRSCVQHGSKYALVVGDKVYTLETGDKAALATLDKQAGKNATVTGTLDGTTLMVTAVAPAK
jgi:hypothetical protein